MDMKGSKGNSNMSNNSMNNQSSSKSGNHGSAMEVIDLAHYWNVVRRQLKKIIALSIVMTLISILVVFSLTPKYSATSTLMIEANES